MGALLEQAFRIKDDIIASLNTTQSSVQMEAFSRRLLENHIRTITHIVKQLSQNIEVLESQIVRRDGVSSDTRFALQFLDQKNLAGIGDLRGRVARCDAGVAELAADLSACGKEIRALRQEVSTARTGVQLQLKELELELSQVERKLDSVMLEHSSSRRSAWEDVQRDLRLPDVKTSSGLKELGDQTERLRLRTERQLHTLLRDGMKEMERKVQELLGPLRARAERMEEHLRRENQARKLRSSADTLSTRVNALEKSLRKEMELIKDEYRTGFRSVHDAISSLTHITDTKTLLDKGKLQKDIK
ncbi:protein FAM81B [Scleropages formosus]|uniref:protein FAM81B n=1 Tax=Scleropages formosus TaxID=113540 RepID=UPI000878BEC6|nr:protein FAM81B [Scleropages formosus]